MRKLLLLGGLFLAAPLAPLFAQNAPNQTVVKPKMEIVFAVDTTGSMGGLIEGAKRKIWAIVNEIVEAKPQPQIKIGFVAYRDKGDAYVTQTTDLTSDLDKAFATLSKFQASGGGDGPEHVNAGLHEAIHKISWSRAGSGAQNLYQVVFLVGDYEPHMDYNDGLSWKKDVPQAADRGIFVNTIRCGDNPEAERAWLQIAKAGMGSYFSLPQDGGTVSIPTPYDDTMLKLGARLEGTTVAIRGKEARQRASLDSYAASAGAAAPAARENALARSTFNAKSAQVYGDFDIVTQAQRGRKARDLKESELPSEWKKLTPAQRQKKLDEKVAERKTVQAQLQKLEKQRAAYIQKELAKKGTKNSFDQKMLATFKAQASRRGFRY